MAMWEELHLCDSPYAEIVAVNYYHLMYIGDSVLQTFHLIK